MSTTATAAGIGLVSLIALSAMVSPAALREQAGDLQERIDQLTSNTIEDMSVGSIKVDAAHGRIDDGRVVETLLLIRVGGLSDAVDLDDVVVTSRTATLSIADVEALRDDDRSIERNVVDGDDLARVTVPVAELDWRSDQAVTLSFHPANGRAQPFELTTPIHFEHDLARLDVEPRVR